jgi:uncharacterized protein (TIGR02246 family)
MKRLNVAFVLCLTLVANAASGGDERHVVNRTRDRALLNNTDTALFTGLANEWKEAYNSKDAGRVAALYADDADYISSHVPGLIAHGRDKIRANFQVGIEAGGHIDSIRIVSSGLSCDLAYLVCQYDATNGGQRVSGRNLIVSKKAGAKWLIVSHMTVVPE